MSLRQPSWPASTGAHSDIWGGWVGGGGKLSQVTASAGILRIKHLACASPVPLEGFFDHAQLEKLSQLFILGE